MMRLTYKMNLKLISAEKFPLNEVMSTAKTDDQLSLYADEFSLPETFKQGMMLYVVNGERVL